MSAGKSDTPMHVNSPNLGPMQAVDGVEDCTLDAPGQQQTVLGATQENGLFPLENSTILAFLITTNKKNKEDKEDKKDRKKEIGYEADDERDCDHNKQRPGSKLYNVNVGRHPLIAAARLGIASESCCVAAGMQPANVRLDISLRGSAGRLRRHRASHGQPPVVLGAASFVSGLGGPAPVISLASTQVPSRGSMGNGDTSLPGQPELDASLLSVAPTSSAFTSPREVVAEEHTFEQRVFKEKAACCVML